MRDDPAVIALVTRVGDGDQEAWDELIERYAPLVWSVCVRYRLSRPDVDDVGQSVWLLLVEQIGTLREPGPAAWSGCGVRRTWSPSSAAAPGPSRMRSREVSIVTDSWDDETVLAALREAQRSRQAVPPEFIEAAKSAYAWHNIDAELAQLTYDSTRESAEALSVRAEAAPIRALTFSSAHLTIELEVTPDSLIGQVVPAQAATVVVQPGSGADTTFPTDETGCFSIRPIPPATFRLHCTTDAGLEVLTRWITL